MEGMVMRNRTKLALAAGGIVLVLAVGTGVGIAASGDDDRPLTGSDLERATEAALAHVGGGTVVETEAGDGGAAYGVEVQREDGSVVEVSLNADFEVIGSAADDDAAEDGEEDDD
jgi:hypothetical protein